MINTDQRKANYQQRSKQSFNVDWNNRKVKLGLQLAFFFFIMTVWEIWGRQVSPLLMTYPTAVAGATIDLVSSGELLKAMLESMKGIIIGTLIATIVGIIVGIIVGSYKTMEMLFDPYINALYATPLVALIPLLILWVGMGLKAKIVIVALFAVFPIIINTYTGVKNVNSLYHDVARAFGTSRWDTFLKIVIPSSIPYIMSGIRLAVGRAIVAQIVAEFLTAISGLGGMIINYSNAFETAKLFVPIILLALLGELMTRIVKIAEQKMSPWKQH